MVRDCSFHHFVQPGMMVTFASALVVAFFGCLLGAVHFAYAPREATNHAQKLISLQWSDMSTVQRQKVISQFFLNESFLPVMIKSSAVANWPALHKWNNLTYFSKEVLPTLDSVTVSQGSRFAKYFIKDYPLANLFDERVIAPRQIQRHNVPTSEFIKDCLNAISQDKYLHFSSKLKPNSPVLRDLGDLDDLFGLTEDGQNRLQNADKYLWMGSKNVTAHTHYDMVHNVFIQLYGKKKFTLFRHEDIGGMYVFPRVHPQVRQSQIDFDHIDLDKFPNFESVKEPIEAVLDAGDVLLLPPDWFHMVSADSEFSISVSLWSGSQEDAFLKSAMQVPIPIDHEWHEDVLVYVVAKIARGIWRECSQPTAAASGSPFGRLWDERYSTVDIPASASREKLQGSPTICHDSKDIPEELKQLITDYLRQIKRRMRQKPNRLHQAVCLDLIEEILAFVFHPEDLRHIIEWMAVNQC
eukprot:TRINITY_DN14322_c0_g1_i1.p1 TRINITY_DN14322_c0_g1~~TRINITY_DN14322_c0_g1_i1.p1  ORF type:complete len:468 (-),score=109.62 TRINITY_DN14322_c0_g1_i1:22-1425(-)